MKTFLIALASLFLLSSFVVTAKNVYVYDEAKLWSRTGPSNEYKVFIRVSPGSKLEVLSENTETGYTQVKDHLSREFWISSKYLTDQPTAKIRLEQSLKTITDNKQKYQSKVKELDRRITAMLPLEKINENLQSKLAKMEIELEQLRQSNSAISSRFNREVYFAGGLTIVVGILFGFVFGLRGRKRSSAWN